ncbi:MAG: enoyl-CoA hydratase-related protein, partial [Pseudomonadales bacterium]|nr:enoyl-CoA hydratase-related protein [Pseudomonadales bacterium]
MTATKDKKMTQPSDTDKPEMILVERREQVGLITLNRPKQLNALNRQLANETLAALRDFDADPQIGAIVITGSSRAFAAGAD